MHRWDQVQEPSLFLSLSYTKLGLIEGTSHLENPRPARGMRKKMIASKVAGAAPGSQSHGIVEGPSGDHLVPHPCSSRAPGSPGCLCCVFAGRADACWDGSLTPRGYFMPVPETPLPRCSSHGGCPQRKQGFLPMDVTEQTWQAPRLGLSCCMDPYQCEMGSSCLADNTVK